jgi:FKBP-type peptidyl-prolyl cis-trans isomerase
MKHITSSILRRTCTAWLLMAAAPLVGAQSPRPAPATPATSAPAAATDPAGAQNTDQIGYLFGLTFGEQLHGVGISDQVTLDSISRGVKDGLQGKKSTPADRQQLQVFVRQVMQNASERNQAAAKEFLARNAHEKDVTTTASGLQYKILVPGDHKAPAVAATDQVTVQYRGKLLDGSEFDSTYSRGTPATFTVNGVIPGWQEALVLMKPGSKWELYVPPELAYGANPKPGIPANSLLIFDVELVSAKPTGAPPGAPAPSAAPKTK